MRTHWEGAAREISIKAISRWLTKRLNLLAPRVFKAADSQPRKQNAAHASFVDTVPNNGKGSGYVYDGSGHVYDGSGHVYDDSGHIYDGSGYIYDGSGCIHDGSGYIYDGSGYVCDGSGYVYDGSGTIPCIFFLRSESKKTGPKIVILG